MLHDWISTEALSLRTLDKRARDGVSPPRATAKLHCLLWHTVELQRMQDCCVPSMWLSYVDNSLRQPITVNHTSEAACLIAAGVYSILTSSSLIATVFHDRRFTSDLIKCLVTLHELLTAGVWYVNVVPPVSRVCGLHITPHFALNKIFTKYVGVRFPVSLSVGLYLDLSLL